MLVDRRRGTKNTNMSRNLLFKRIQKIYSWLFKRLRTKKSNFTSFLSSFFLINSSLKTQKHLNTIIVWERQKFIDSLNLNKVITSKMQGKLLDHLVDRCAHKSGIEGSILIKNHYFNYVNNFNLFQGFLLILRR